MARRINIATNLHADIADDGVAELVFGPQGGMPATDAAGYAALGSVWARLADEPRVRCILVRSLGKGFCAGGTLDMVQAMVGSEAARLRVMREGRAILQGMIDCDLPIVSALNGAAVGVGAAVALLADVSIAGHRAKTIDGHTCVCAPACASRYPPAASTAAPASARRCPRSPGARRSARVRAAWTAASGPGRRTTEPSGCRRVARERRRRGPRTGSSPARSAPSPPGRRSPSAQSVWPATSHTRVPAGSPITAAPAAPATRSAHWPRPPCRAAARAPHRSRPR